MSSTDKDTRFTFGTTFQWAREIDILNDPLPEFHFDVVYHLASPTSVPESLENPEKYEQGCYQMTRRVVDMCRKFQVSQMVFSSTSAVYGDTTEFPTPEGAELHPLSPYASYKLLAEDYIDSISNHMNTRFTICRFFNVFGEEQHNQGSYAPAVAIFLKQHKENSPITVTGDGLQTRDYIYVKDIVAFLIGVMGQTSYKKECFNLGYGIDLTIRSIAECFGSEVVHIAPREEPRKSLADISKAKQMHGWEPKVSVVQWIKGVIPPPDL